MRHTGNVNLEKVKLYYDDLFMEANFSKFLVNWFVSATKSSSFALDWLRVSNFRKFFFSFNTDFFGVSS